LDDGGSSDFSSRSLGSRCVRVLMDLSMNSTERLLSVWLDSMERERGMQQYNITRENYCKQGSDGIDIGEPGGRLLLYELAVRQSL